MHHFAGILLGVIVPVLFAVIRLFFAYPMSWLVLYIVLRCSTFYLILNKGVHSN